MTVYSDQDLIIEQDGHFWNILKAGHIIGSARSLRGALDIIPKMGHASLDAQPTHCVFCGSGAITGRSDGMIECSVCSKTFVAMEQPAYATQPSTDWSSNEIDDPADPAAIDPAMPPTAEVDLSGEPTFIAPEDDNFSKSSKFSTDSGAQLLKRDYLRHLAMKYAGR